MSKRNRQKHRRNRQKHCWYCLGCGERMHPEVGTWALRDLKPGQVALHVCGNCRHWHIAAGDGLRNLTAAERFEIEMRIPKTMRLAETIPAPLSDGTPGATLVQADEED